VNEKIRITVEDGGDGKGLRRRQEVERITSTPEWFRSQKSHQVRKLLGGVVFTIGHERPGGAERKELSDKKTFNIGGTGGKPLSLTIQIQG